MAAIMVTKFADLSALAANSGGCSAWNSWVDIVLAMVAEVKKGMAEVRIRGGLPGGLLSDHAVCV